VKNRIRALILDMDGVLWRGEEPAPGLVDFFALLHERGIRYIMATNNASKTPEQYVDQLARFGVHVPPETVLTSAQATASFLRRQAPPGTPVYIIGEEGLRRALTEAGFVLSADGARYVVVGWDRGLTFEKLAQATLLIRAGAAFIGTNPDRTWPGERGLLPGNGAILAALETATDTRPIIIGKPETPLFEEALARLGASPEETAMVGDRLETDILGGQRMGLFTILLLSGVARREDLETSPVRPDLVLEDLAALTAWLKG